MRFPWPCLLLTEGRRPGQPSSPSSISYLEHGRAGVVFYICAKKWLQVLHMWALAEPPAGQAMPASSLLLPRGWPRRCEFHRGGAHVALGLLPLGQSHRLLA